MQLRVPGSPPPWCFRLKLRRSPDTYPSTLQPPRPNRQAHTLIAEFHLLPFHSVPSSRGFEPFPLETLSRRGSSSRCIIRLRGGLASPLFRVRPGACIRKPVGRSACPYRRRSSVSSRGGLYALRVWRGRPLTPGSWPVRHVWGGWDSRWCVQPWPSRASRLLRVRMKGRRWGLHPISVERSLQSLTWSLYSRFRQPRLSLPNHVGNERSWEASSLAWEDLYPFFEPTRNILWSPIRRARARMARPKRSYRLHWIGLAPLSPSWRIRCTTP